MERIWETLAVPMNRDGIYYVTRTTGVAQNTTGMIWKGRVNVILLSSDRQRTSNCSRLNHRRETSGTKSQLYTGFNG